MNTTSTFNCFGLIIHGYSMEEVERFFEHSVKEERQTIIVTANPEILLEAKRSPRYWAVLRQADLRIVDSFGLQCIGLLNGSRPIRLPGVDCADRLLALAATHGWRVAFLGGASGVADRAAWAMRMRFPNLSIAAEEGGYVAPDGTLSEEGKEACGRLTQFAPELLFVAFGHPKQEYWIASHVSEFPSVKLAMGVGGTFDYWSGRVVRAPHLIQRIGMEWAWRLLIEPSRWKRIFRAVVLFPLVAIFDHFFDQKNSQRTPS